MMASAAPVRVDDPVRISIGKRALLARVLTSVDQSSMLTYFGWTAITGAIATCSLMRTEVPSGAANANHNALVNSAPPSADNAARPNVWRALHDDADGRAAATISLGCRQRRSSGAGGGRKIGVSSSSLLRTVCEMTDAAGRRGRGRRCWFPITRPGDPSERGPSGS